MKNFTILITFALAMLGQYVAAQLPQVSTSENPVWYFIQVQGENERTDLVFTAESEYVHGRSKIASSNLSDLDKQLWRFEQDGNNYVIINKLSGQKLNFTRNSGKGIVSANLSDNPVTQWQILSMGSTGYYNLKATTALSGYSSLIYAHQANNWDSRNYVIMFESTSYNNTVNSYFKFILYESPVPEISTENQSIWYIIKSGKPEYANMCITDVTEDNLSGIKFSINYIQENNEKQQWKLIKRADNNELVDFVNKATGNIIQTSAVFDNYYFTQAANTVSASNGWSLIYATEGQYEIGGYHTDNLFRYLNAASGTETADLYLADKSLNSGFSWIFKKVSYISEYPTQEQGGTQVFLSSIATSNSMIETMPGTIKIAPSSGTASSFQSGENIEKSFDGNLSSLYHSSWTQTTFPVTLVYNFTDVNRIDSVVYIPRQSGSNGNFKQLEIWYTTKQQGRNKLGEFDFQGRATATTIPLNAPLENPISIEFIINSGEGGFASCAEMQFYRINPEENSFDIFEDELMTSLKPGITSGDINQISNIFIRDVATAIYNNTYSTEGRVAEYEAYPTMSKLNSELMISAYSKYENPTGIYLPAGKHIVVAKDIQPGKTINLIIPDYKTTSGSLPYQSFPLENGMNIITVSGNGGLGYISYYSATPDEETPVNVHFMNSYVQGYFDITRHTNDDWNRLLENAKYHVLDAVGRYSHLCFPIEGYKQNAWGRGVELVNAYDTIITYQQRFYGWEKYNKRPKNRVLSRVNYSYFMYKDNDGASFENSTMGDVTNPQRALASWGVNHEIGHIHQFKFNNWHGMGEVSVNFPNVYIQHLLINPNSDGGDDYDDAFYAMVVPGVPYLKFEGNSAVDHNYGRLIPFSQLYHYFAEKGNYDFYPDLNEALRNTTENTANWSIPDYEMNFIRKACEVSQMNLLSFFEAWGFIYYTDNGRSTFEVGDYGGKKVYSLSKTKVDEFKAEIEAMGYPVPDTNICLVKANGNRIPYTSQPVITSVPINSTDKNICIHSNNGYIYVEGAEEYTVRNVSGILMNEKSQLPAGVYLVTVNGNTTLISVK